MSFDVDVAVTLGERRIACRIEPVEGITVLFGPSGAGKTSVLNMIAGLLRPERGHVRVGGQALFDGTVNVAPEARRCGYVFQDARLFPHLKVAGNLDYARREPGNRAEILEVLGIAHLIERWPRTLSGGEARRVAIGRALYSAPDFLLLDEPLSSLDRARREEIMALIERLRDAFGLPMLLVTHDAAEAERLGSHIVAMDG